MAILRRLPAGPTRSPGRSPRVVITATVAVLVLLSAAHASAVAAVAGAAAPAVGTPTRQARTTQAQATQTQATQAQATPATHPQFSVAAPVAPGGSAPRSLAPRSLAPRSLAPPGDAERGVWPLTPHVVVRGFSPPSTAYGTGHRGVDLAGTAGEEVRATLAGRVSYAGRLAGIGIVVIDHGATRTTYEPVGAAVEVGAVVAAGDVIGHLELAGSHCLPDTCLHWGWIATDGTYLDPLDLVGQSPVRLLPLD